MTICTRSERMIKKLMAPGLIAMTCGIVSHEPLAQEPDLHVLEPTPWQQEDEQYSIPLDVRKDEGFCYLSMMTGKFEGGGEEVRVFVEDERWRVGGKSGQEGVAANARCVIWNPEKPLTRNEYSWRQGEQPTHIDLTDLGDSFCYLTSVAGDFEGGGERVELIRLPAGDWELGGASGQDGIAAEAQCVSSAQPFLQSDVYLWTQNLTDQESMIALPFGSAIPLGVREDEGFWCRESLKAEVNRFQWR